jgi:glutathione S-transferase
VLEVDGKMLAQSHAIARFVAKKHGLAGKDAWEAALCDQFVDATVDLLQHYRSMR